MFLGCVFVVVCVCVYNIRTTWDVAQSLVESVLIHVRVCVCVCGECVLSVYMRTKWGVAK